MKWFGSSGIRGVAFEEFTLELASKIGLATGTNCKDVVLGRDARTTGQVFSTTVASALMSAGSHVSDVGIVTTPTLAFAARKRDSGIMITASHNPPEYNGIKLWNPDGSSFDTNQMEQIERSMEKRLKLANWRSVGSLSYDHSATSEHMDRILSFVENSKLKIVVDCANGPASMITPYVLEEMGCKVITLNAHLDGGFPGRPAEPADENLSSLKEAVVKLKADLGIAHDGDADRMVAVDDKGRYAGGDILLKLFARELGAKKIVVPVDATMILEDWFGKKVFRTKVGDTFVSEKVKQVKADFGGEPSGTWIFPKITFCPDGVFAAAKLAEICNRKRLSRLIDSLPSYPLIKETVQFKESCRKRVFSNIEKEISSIKTVQVDRIDGFRIRYDDGWALIRLSGTEPKIRIAVEAISRKRAEELMTTMRQMARRVAK